MTTKEFTLEEMLQAVEQSKLPNNNDSFIMYSDNSYITEEGERYYFRYSAFKSRSGPRKPVFACVIGEAFLNLGFAENGIQAAMLSNALSNIKPDNEEIILKIGRYHEYFADLSDFINSLNGIKGYRGKKRIPQLVRKYFSKSLDRVIRVTDNDIVVVK